MHRLLVWLAVSFLFQLSLPGSFILYEVQYVIVRFTKTYSQVTVANAVSDNRFYLHDVICLHWPVLNPRKLFFGSSGFKNCFLNSVADKLDVFYKKMSTDGLQVAVKCVQSCFYYPIVRAGLLRYQAYLWFYANPANLKCFVMLRPKLQYPFYLLCNI